MLEVKYRKTAELIPYARNSRTHSTEQVQQIAGSIKEFGFTNPILIDEEGGIIAGHGRVMASQRMGLEEVPTITLYGLTEAQKKAYVIADNKLALNAGWDEEMLRVELEELNAWGYDLDLTGFSNFEIDEKLIEENEDLKEGDTDKPEILFTEELREENNYIILKFTNDYSWLQAETIIDELKTVKALHSKDNYEAKGLGRVIDGEKFINKYLGQK